MRCFKNIHIIEIGAKTYEKVSFMKTQTITIII